MEGASRLSPGPFELGQMFFPLRPRMAVTGDHGGHASSRRSRAAETSGAVQCSKEEGRLRGVDPAAPPQPVRVNGEAGGTPPPTHAFGFDHPSATDPPRTDGRSADESRALGGAAAARFSRRAPRRPAKGDQPNLPSR